MFEKYATMGSISHIIRNDNPEDVINRYLEYFNIQRLGGKSRYVNINNVKILKPPFSIPELLFLNKNDRENFLNKISYTTINMYTKRVLRNQYNSDFLRDEYVSTFIIQSDNPLVLSNYHFKENIINILTGECNFHYPDWNNNSVTIDIIYRKRLAEKIKREGKKLTDILNNDINQLIKEYENFMIKIYKYIANDYNYIVNKEIVNKINSFNINYPNDNNIIIKGKKNILTLTLSYYAFPILKFTSNGILYKYDVSISIKDFVGKFADFLTKELNLNDVSKEKIEDEIYKTIIKHHSSFPEANKYIEENKYGKTYEVNLYGTQCIYSIHTPTPNKDNYKHIINLFCPERLNNHINNIVKIITQNAINVYLNTIDEILQSINAVSDIKVIGG